MFVVRPGHNPIGPFDFGGVYDEASDRQRTTRELIQQGYEDAYQQFIEPVVASGNVWKSCDPGVVVSAKQALGGACRNIPKPKCCTGAKARAQGATPLTTPIYATSTFVFANAAELEFYQEGRSGKYIYSRYSNPTVQAVEEKLAVLEGADAALVTSSGMAATTTALCGLLSAGEEVVCSAAIYGGTLHLIVDFLERFGVAWRGSCRSTELAAPECVIGSKTKVLSVREPDQSDASLRGHPQGHRAFAGRTT